MGKLVHFHVDGSAAELRLDRQRVTIGRRPDNDFCLPYPAVSGEHAAVVTILADSFLEDLGSTNGTLVNGAAITKHFLRDRDRIDVGQQILIYVADDAATLEPPPPRSRDLPEDAREREAAEATSVVPAALRAKRRSDVAVPVPVAPADGAERAADASTASGEIADSLPADQVPAAASTAPVADTVPPSAPPERRTDVEPALKVVSGAKAGRIVALVKDETLIGRPGVQVVALRRMAGEVRMVPVEGATPPSINGVKVVPEGCSIAVGDILEVAGTKLEVVAAMTPSSASRPIG